MGSVCGRDSGKKRSNSDVQNNIPVVSKSSKTQLSDTPESTTNNHSSPEILDDDLKAQIIEVVDEYIASIPTAYQTERDHIVDEMKRLAPEPYLGLLYSEYPDVNGPTVSEMARRKVTSNEAKQQLIDRINERIESSFASRTADLNPTHQETTRPVV